MSVSYGFYNSLNKDRLYSAVQMSQIFDGVILDGVFMSIGTRLMVTPGDGMTGVVGIGRAWFLHTWTYNDAPLILNHDPAEVILDRIDTYVLDVDGREESRKNTFMIVKGAPASSPLPPDLIWEEDHRQYPLANVRIPQQSTSIAASNITNLVGVDPKTPFVTGVLQGMNIESLVSQWEAQWTEFFNKQTNDMNQTALDWEQQWDTWFTTETSNDSAEWRQYMDEQKAAWMAWVAEMKDITDETALAKMVALEERVGVLEEFKDHLTDEFAIYYDLDDSSDDAILDSTGNMIDGRVIFARR